MNYFWVNHNKSFQEERGNGGKGSIDGKIWCPKKEKGDRRSTAYDYMKKIEIGDIIISYAERRISNIGIAKSKAITVYNYEKEGWEVKVDFSERLENKILLNELPIFILKYLRGKHLPIQRKGDHFQGKQKCYLSLLKPEMGEKIITFCRKGNLDIYDNELLIDLDEIDQATKDNATMKERLTQARLGQGKFRADVLTIFPECPITKVSISPILRASHIKPWRVSSNTERLDPFNGLMLAAHVDALFDSFLISFDTKGKMQVSKCIDIRDLEKLGIDISKQIVLQEKHLPYIKWHLDTFKDRQKD